MNTRADDRFVRYYTEKLWEMIPAIYKHEDGLGNNPGVLRSFIEIFAEQAAILRRSQDRLWEDQFIELCNDWAIPYIGDLVGTRLLSAQLKRGQRIDVAKTIYYRRRKGTPRILEELINDISGWEGKLVEGFKRLARTRHGLDPHPARFAGINTGTLPGGWANLRSPDGSEIADGPFEEFFHLPDMRKPKGIDGRYGINRLNFHLYRLIAFEVSDADPFSLGDQEQFHFDPSGRSIPLFSKRSRPAFDLWDDWHSALEWELPLPIRCRLLAANLNALIPASISVSNGNPLLPIGVPVTFAAALPLSAWPLTLMTKDLAIDAEQGRFQLRNGIFVNQVSASYHYGFSGPFGAGTYDRRDVEDSEPTLPAISGGGGIGAGVMVPTAIVQIDDNKTYHVVSNHLTITKYTLQSANNTRPYVILDADWILGTQPNADAELVLDGLWIGNQGGNQFNIILQGDFESVTIKNCTFDPGGDSNANGLIHPVTVFIDGSVEKLCIEKSILGPVQTTANGLIGDEVCIEDSIIQSVDSTVHALQVSTGVVHLYRTTLFGSLQVHRLYASEVLITGVADVTDNQTGCFRFSAAPMPPLSRIPRPYESFLFISDNKHWFGSRLFGQPSYAQLTETAPVELVLGGENGAEIGVFNSLLNPLKLDGLKAKVEEYMPFGLIPSFINET